MNYRQIARKRISTVGKDQEMLRGDMVWYYKGYELGYVIGSMQAYGTRGVLQSGLANEYARLKALLAHHPSNRDIIQDGAKDGKADAKREIELEHYASLKKRYQKRRPNVKRYPLRVLKPIQLAGK